MPTGLLITQGRSQSIYLSSKNLKMRFWYCRFTHTNNIRIIQASKLVHEIKLSNTAINNSNNNQFFLDSEVNDGQKSEPNIDIHITPIPTPLNKIIESIKNLCDIYIKSKYIKIIKYKAITPAIQKLEEIHANLWGLHDPLPIPKKSYVSLLLGK